VVQLLVSRVDYDGAQGKVAITFHPLGLKTLAAELLGQVEQRIARLRAQMEAVQQQRLDEAEATRALAGLDPAWATLTPPEQARVVQLLVSRVDYDGAKGKVSITFHPLGLKTLAGEWLGQVSEGHTA